MIISNLNHICFLNTYIKCLTNIFFPVLFVFYDVICLCMLIVYYFVLFASYFVFLLLFVYQNNIFGNKILH